MKRINEIGFLVRPSIGRNITMKCLFFKLDCHLIHEREKAFSPTHKMLAARNTARYIDFKHSEMRV